MRDTFRQWQASAPVLRYPLEVACVETSDAPGGRARNRSIAVPESVGVGLDKDHPPA